MKANVWAVSAHAQIHNVWLRRNATVAMESAKTVLVKTIATINVGMLRLIQAFWQSHPRHG